MKPVTIESVMAVYEAEAATLRARVASLEAALRGMLASVNGLDLMLNYPGGHHAVDAARLALAPRSERREGEPLGHRDDEERGRYRPTGDAPSSFSELLRQEAAERGEAWAITCASEGRNPERRNPAAPKEEA